MTRPRIVFAGSPAVAVPSLAALVASGQDVVGVVTREDSPLGRRRVLTATPVAVAAEERGLPVIRANRLTGDAASRIAALEPDLGVIVAYGGLVREPLLSLPAHGWINLHFSLLPRWRGAAPVQHAILAGDELTGASVFRLVEGLDEGPVYGTLTQSIGAQETAGHLLVSLAESGAELLSRVVESIAAGTARAEAQEGDPTFAPKLTSADGRIDWSERASAIDHRIRAVTPEPGASTTVDGAALKILGAALARDAAPRPPGRIEEEGGRILVGTASEPIELLEVQPAGKRLMPATDWWRGRRGEQGVIAR
jgi:methionyl-tRNA formyltransferase